MLRLYKGTCVKVLIRVVVYINKLKVINLKLKYFLRKKSVTLTNQVIWFVLICIYIANLCINVGKLVQARVEVGEEKRNPESE